MSSPRLPRVSRSSLGLSALLAIASCYSPLPATEVVARIDSDLAAGTELTRVEAHVFGLDDAIDELGRAVFSLSASDGAQAAGYALPLSFSVAPQSADSARRFRLVVAGYGRSAPSQPVTLQVERQVITSFRPHRALRLDVFLGRICVNVLCRAEGEESSALTCGDDGACGPVPEVVGEPEIEGDAGRDPERDEGGARDASTGGDRDAGPGVDPSPDAAPLEGDTGSPDGDTGVPPPPDAGQDAGPACGPGTASCTCQPGFMYTALGCVDVDECADSAINDCDPSAPCAQTLAPGYTCVGQFADWRMPDSALGDRSAAPAYSVLADDLVRDDVTGLSWQRSVDANSTRSAAAADSYCAALVQGGFDDWRVPSRIELASLLDTARAAPLIDAAAFPGSASASFWTRDTQNPGARWGISFADGTNAGHEATSALLVRCVRSGAVASGTPASRYVTDTAAGTITDTRTGLVWQRGVNSTPSTFAAAMMTCAAEGRRLPSLKELLTLADPARGSALAPSFPPHSARPFWTSSRVPGAAGQVYVVTSDQGSVSGVSSTDTTALGVRCVRRP